MRRPGEHRRSHNAGELAPDLAGAVDIKQYWSAARRAKNVDPVPQSGFRQSAGTRDIGPSRRRLAALSQSSVSSSPGPHTGTQTVWQATVSGSVAAVVVAGIAADDHQHALSVQVHSGGSWHQIGPTIAIGTEPRAQSFAFAPAEGLAATAVRLRATFSAEDTLTLGTISVLAETGTQDPPRYVAMRHDSGDCYLAAAVTGFVDLWRDDDWIAGIHVPALSADCLPELCFYAENATIGLFHRSMRSQRIRRAGSAAEWVLDDWPWDGLPKVDYGAAYPRTDDVWEIWIKWVDSSHMYLTLIVDGEQTEAVNSTDSGGTPVQPPLGGGGGTVDWDLFCSNLQAKLESLPSLGPGVTVAHASLSGNAHKLIVTFSGALSGREYQVDAQVTNTASISALATHIQFGKTEYEPLISEARGWPGVTALVQDRLAYADFLSERSAIALSMAGEYFKLDIEAAGPAAPRLDRLRAGQTSERVLAMLEASYFIAFTDRAVHFASNRTINKTDPLNYAVVSNKGIVPNTLPAALGSSVYYVAIDHESGSGSSGHQLVSLSYDEIVTSFVPKPESLLASHLVQGVIRTAPQLSASDGDAEKLWLLRADGRLVSAHLIPSQEILGFTEWIPAADGAVREIVVDAANRLRLAVERDGAIRHERLDRTALLHATLTRTPDLAGAVAGLGIHEGREVWAIAEGWILGPFTVEDGTIALGEAFGGTVEVGPWQAPCFETMPHYRILPSDEILQRPGRIHSVSIHVMDTTSIAVGANGQPPRDVPLARAGDPLDQPTPPFTGIVERYGMPGAVTGTTLVITQTRPGTLRVRDYNVREAL